MDGKEIEGIVDTFWVGFLEEVSLYPRPNVRALDASVVLEHEFLCERAFNIDTHKSTIINNS